MHQPSAILFGAGFTGLTTLSLGLLLVQALRLPVSRTESRLLGFALGAATLSSLVFAANTFWVARPGWFAVIGGLSIAACLWRRSWRYGEPANLPGVGRVWQILLLLAFGYFGVFTFFYAMAPEISPDGSAYHLGAISRYLREGGFGWYTHNMYANLPMGIEMLFEFAFAFGKHSAAALVHWQLYVVLGLLVLQAGKRFGFPHAGAAAAILVFCSPVVSLDASTAYVDVGAAAVVFACVYVLLLWETNRSGALLIPAGLLAGFCYGTKMTNWPAAPFAVLFVAWTLWRRREPWLKPAATVALCAAILILPWLAKNALVVGNPFSPFLNKYFPNPNVWVAFEEEYRNTFRNYSGAITSPTQIPLEVTVRGATLTGLLGPIFLLAPVALFALRWPFGRRLLLAALVFSLSYPGNIGTRFLISPLPFLALALGMVFSNWRVAGLAAVFHGLASLPPVVALYAAQHSWRMEEYRYDAAVGKESFESFMDRRMPEYRLMELIDQQVPPHGKLLMFTGLPESYTSREILVVYQSGWTHVLGDHLVVGLSASAQPRRTWDFHFAPRDARRIRFVQTKSVKGQWNVTELRIFGGGAEIPRDLLWKLRASPDPWYVQLAFDNCPTTRWRTWESARPGMYIEVDLGRPFSIDHVRAEVSPDQTTSARVELETAAGKWETVAAEPQISELPPPENIRRIAMDDLKRAGITHLVVGKSDWLTEEIQSNLGRWGLTVIGESPANRLYKID